MTVYELNREQLIELKEAYLCNPDTVDVTGIDCPSWGDLANADRIISDDVIFHEYSGTTFTTDDFFCTAGMEE